MTEQIDSCLKFGKGWHYKLVQYVWGRSYFNSWGDPKYPRRISLCTYFWSVVLSTFMYPVSIVWHTRIVHNHEDLSKAIGIWILISTFVQIIIVVLAGLSEWWWIGLAIFFGGIGAGAGVAGAIIGIENLYNRIKYYRRQRYKEVVRKPRKPSLIKEFIKAKKNKVCPCIEFIDEDKK